MTKVTGSAKLAGSLSKEFTRFHLDLYNCALLGRDFVASLVDSDSKIIRFDETFLKATLSQDGTVLFSRKIEKICGEKSP